MSQTKKKKTEYKGKNIRVSDEAFLIIKKFVDKSGLKLGKFVETSTLEKIQEKESR